MDTCTLGHAFCGPSLEAVRRSQPVPRSERSRTLGGVGQPERPHSVRHVQLRSGVERFQRRGVYPVSWSMTARFHRSNLAAVASAEFGICGSAPCRSRRSLHPRSRRRALTVWADSSRTPPPRDPIWCRRSIRSCDPLALWCRRTERSSARLASAPWSSPPRALGWA